ncbi:type II toxin-antitoxin system RelE/ParE family toxin [Pseudomonas citronellolis]|uniref:type II toxin-antitoxin system RelE/ParE family toxin n=1 Tax=Pseudomonas citronellolis TaxID=53408 RepID=UPI0023E37B90|nr:type II toxin-antitoxin system RelE/ParE family toxin [Pseudomonas citronellolis]MDF3934193.1 type II toxin-antitoxin system RelE/ParE family toxin [Pseudomonas citronellolis]
MSLLWTHKAAGDLDGLYDHYVVLIGPEKALRAIQDMVEQVQALADLGLSSLGQPSEVPGVRELALERWPYQAAYRVKGRDVQILRIDSVDNPG